MPEQLLLPAPYGYGNGYHVSLRVREGEGFSEADTLSAVMSFGCPRRIAHKAVSCLRHSGRYDCVMSPTAWDMGVSLGLRQRLRSAGVGLDLRAKPDPNEPGLRDRVRRQQGPAYLSKFGLDNLPRAATLEDAARSLRQLIYSK